MPYSIEIRPLAAIEVVEAFDWYESQRENLGAEFLAELDILYEKLLLNPMTYSYFDENVRSAKMSRFPYVVVYEIFGNSIIIYSVFMSSQDPSKKRTV